MSLQQDIRPTPPAPVIVTRHGPAAERASGTQPVLITPLTSIRFFAAVHIFLFHFLAMAWMAGPGSTSLGTFDQLPGWVVAFLTHGYCSTSLFFLLSGFILTYLYVGPDGCQTADSRDFWLARLTRVYPLHFAVLLLLVPFTLSMSRTFVKDPSFFGMPVSHEFFLAIGGVLSLTLTQAWFPEYALSWNAPTWALSAVLFFYLMFPPLVRWLARLSQPARWALLLACPVVSLIPSMVLLLVFGVPRYDTFARDKVLAFWNEFVMRTPLFWLPHFLMGMLLARIFNINRFERSWRRGPSRWGVSAGDLAAALLLALFCVKDEIIARNVFGGRLYPHPFLRHGLLAPLYLVVLYDLANGRGLLAWLLSLPGLRPLGEASFSIFIWQVPVLILLHWLFPAAESAGAVIRLVLAVLTVTVVSLLSVYLFEKPLARWLRRKLIGRRTTPTFGPREPRIV
jgi:peptidoglycan/LPS O-acetylase OafA/YrhL